MIDLQKFEAALTEELKSIAVLEGRVYPLDAPEANSGQGVPYLIYVSSEGVRDRTLDGYLKSKRVLIEINVIGTRYADLKSISPQAMNLLIGMEQRQIGTDGPHINEVVMNRDPVELYENEPDLYRSVIEAVLYFEE